MRFNSMPLNIGLCGPACQGKGTVILLTIVSVIAWVRTTLYNGREEHSPKLLGLPEITVRLEDPFMIKLKRVYEPPAEDDGLRVLVERLWPRGISKERAALGLWLKEIAPSTELRKWYGHDPQKWQKFCEAYWAELRHKADLLTL